MSKDPRRRGENGGQHVELNGASSVRQSVLFGDADDEDPMDVDEAVPIVTAPVTLAESTSISSVGGSIIVQHELISRIITPSPFSHHNSGPTSSRFRNALSRITLAPTSDVEAWQALMAEVNGCYRSMINIYAIDAETFSKLDWIESCYGALFKHFPYASTHYASIIDILLALTARYGEEGGPTSDYGMDLSRRSVICEAKLDHLFKLTLGVDMDGTVIDINIHFGMCVWVVEIWSLYIRKVERDAKRLSSTMPPDEREKYVRDTTVKAYDAAILQTGSTHNNHLIWKKYLDYVKSWSNTANNRDHNFTQIQMQQLRKVYQRLATNPMTGLDQLWQEYEVFEKGQSEALAQALIAEYYPKYQNARTCYLERNRVYSLADLEINRLAASPVEESDEDYTNKMEEEYLLLKLWKTRCSYERTNPLRLESHELARRIRNTFKEFVCIMTRHPESWHMWSNWELEKSENRRIEKALNVLRLAQQHIPDSTLLAYGEAQLVEIHTERKEECMEVMKKFLERSPNTLGFVLYQKLVRRYNGKDAARKVFAKARRILVSHTRAKEIVDEKNQSDSKFESIGKDGGDKDHAGSKKLDDQSNRQMVTNRLDAMIGPVSSDHRDQFGRVDVANTNTTKHDIISMSPPGPITWHLYAAHAMMEHRLNQCPEAAARIYELGLTKHSIFISKPPYVLRYAQLLLELNDTMNLRALLTRAVAAFDGSDNKASLAAMWDMNLYFESIINGADPSGVATIQTIERERRAAIMGPDIEDVGHGGFVGAEESALIGAQKSTLGELLIRAEGYDVSSRIVNGMNRTVDLIGVMGLLGDVDYEFTKSRLRAKHATLSKDNDDVPSGGRSDSGYQKRLNYQLLMHSGLPNDSVLDTGGPTSSKVLSARERLHHGTGAASGPGQGTAIMLAIQQSPEWLRAMLLLLPASKLRLPIVAKPPPHVVEMALSQLRQTTLPAERPSDPLTDSNKRTLQSNDGHSSDEDEDTHGRNGYSGAFRARQRSRILKNAEN